MLDVMNHPDSFYRENYVKQRRLEDIYRGKNYTKAFDELAERHWNASLSSPRGDVSPETLKASRRQTKPKKKGPNTLLVSQLFKLPDHCSDEATTEKDVYIPDELRNTLDRADKLNAAGEVTGRFIKGKQLRRNGGVMSRVGQDSPRRQMNVKSSFITHNGSVRVISPPTPRDRRASMRNRALDSVSKEFSFDPEIIEREKTYQMLQRIDRILHPYRNEVPNHIMEESEEENESSKSPSLPDTEDAIPNPALKHKDFQKPPMFLIRTKQKPVITNSADLADYLQKQKDKSVDTIKKCELWINNWVL